MSEALELYRQELLQAVMRDADADGQYAEDAFFELACNELIEAGELEEANRSYFQSSKVGRVDGYGGVPSSADGVLTLILLDFHPDVAIETLTATEMEATFKRGVAFVKRALEPAFRSKMEESSAGFGVADMIAGSWSAVSKLKIILLSTRVLSARVDGRESDELNGVPVVYSVWDLGRLQRYVASGRSREDLVVDLADHGGALPALPAHLGDAGYEAYLVVIPAARLASIYDRWGTRLLEQNVRVFLQARGKVNKGIRNTLDQEPDMFFAYNNGITATADAIVYEKGTNGVQLTKLVNLQIVNGGQTTASVHAAYKRSAAQLSRVFVQMKLSVVPGERSEEVVPKISEYANSQNKVSAADFFANHPFHVRMEEFSRRILAPSSDGSFRQSKWFYERARGQYQDARGNLTVAERKRFDLEYPKDRVFTKTDLAKFLLVWERLPHIVSRGAQKNFAAFADLIGKQWNDAPDEFNEAYYRASVAKAIVFRATEKLVTRQPWYDGGYRANVVAYAIAKLATDVMRKTWRVNLDDVWKRQGISEALGGALTIYSEAVKDVIVNPDAGHRNVTEWAKQQACWNRISELEVRWPASIKGALITGEESRERSREAVKDQRLLNGIEQQKIVIEMGGRSWDQIRAWGESRGLLSQKELDILGIAAGIPKKIPTEKQCSILLDALARIREEGCRIGLAD